MKTGISILIVISLFLMPLSAFASDLINEPFDYSDDYANHGWIFSSPFVYFPTAPRTSQFGTYAYGVHEANPWGSTFEAYIEKTFPSNITNGVLYYTFDLSIGNDTYLNQLSINHHLTLNGSTSDLLSIRLYPSIGEMNFSTYGSASNVGKCSGIVVNRERNLTGSFSVVLNIDANSYSAYFNGSIIGDCQDKTLHLDASPIKVWRLHVGQFIEALETMDLTIDNILISSTGANTSLTDTGYPCSSDAMCASGKCEYGSCVLKQAGESCTYSNQCASNDCYNGLCTKPSLSQNLNRAVDENFGSDSMTLNIISLFLMIGIPAAIIIAAGGASVAVLFSIVVFIVLGFGFTLMGWLSPFITLGIVVVSLIVTVFAFMIKGSG